MIDMPLKRSEALQPLSRQHHNGLLFCLLLQKGVKKQADTEVMKDFIQWFWYKDLHPHFQLEERYFDSLGRKYVPLRKGLDRMIAEHYDLKSIINEIFLCPTYSCIDELREKLNAHIRFEERELFPLIEQTVTEQERSALQKLLGQAKEDNCMNYPAKFWE